MKKIYRKAAAGIAAAFLILGTMPHSWALSAHSAIVIDAVTGRVLYEKNADQRSLIASTTKIMTGLLICENCEMEDPVTISQEAVGIEGSSLNLQAGEQITVEELLYGMMLCSGNDAAAALAIHCSGNFSTFVSQMNERAASLGLKRTKFSNPHGLDEKDHYSTARELAYLTAAAMENTVFREVVSTRQITFGDRVYTNHNKLLWQYEGALGVKTGYTKAAGRVLVSCAQRNGRRLIAVTINAPDDWQDHKSMLDQGFSAYQVSYTLELDQSRISVPDMHAAGKPVCFSMDEDWTVSAMAEETISFRFVVPFSMNCYQIPAQVFLLIDGKIADSRPLNCQRNMMEES